ncbi:hypothetical protein [Oenococcus sp.]|uniref:hypothetical protein n=1 Tax=Oenococcus sp. TaxID=1979414 RepID=UPI0039EC362C
MEEFKKFLKITASFALITGGILVASTVFAAKKIDESADDWTDKADSLKDKFTDKVKKISDKTTGEIFQEGKKTLGDAASKVKDVLTDATGVVKDKVGELASKKDDMMRKVDEVEKQQKKQD